MTDQLMIAIAIMVQGVIHILECHHDAAVIRGKDINKTQFSDKWHIYDAATWAVVYVLVVFVSGSWLLLFTGLAWRYVLLQVYLNRLMGWPLEHLGGGTIDTWSRKVLGPTGTLVSKFVIMMVMVIYSMAAIIRHILSS